MSYGGFNECTGYVFSGKDSCGLIYRTYLPSNDMGEEVDTRDFLERCKNSKTGVIYLESVYKMSDKSIAVDEAYKRYRAKNVFFFNELNELTPIGKFHYNLSDRICSYTKLSDKTWTFTKLDEAESQLSILELIKKARNEFLTYPHSTGNSEKNTNSWCIIL